VVGAQVTTLDAIAAWHGTDKASTYAGGAGHGYTAVYEKLFETLMPPTDYAARS
jgi:hypothetical protein